MANCDKCNIKSDSPKAWGKALCCLLQELVNSQSGGEQTALLTDIKALLESIDGKTFNYTSFFEDLVDNTDEIEPKLEDIKTVLAEMLAEMKNDDFFSDALWEDPNGVVVIKRVTKNDDGSLTTEFLNQDETPFAGDVNTLKPYSRQTILTETGYCANSIPFTLIQFRDHDSKAVVATIWRNDNDLTESPTAPTGATKGACVPAAACKENKTYQIKGTRTITFDPNKIYGYKAGVWNLSSPIAPLTGNASLTEGAGLIQEYGFGDSFGNGFGDVLMPISVVIAGLDADSDVRISVIQECGYTATIV
jgi:hypothetical protein